MLLAAALALTSVLPPVHLHRPQVTQRHYESGGWRLTVGHDRFTDALVCSLKTHTMHYRSGTLIFHIKRGIDTTHAVYKIDDGPPTPVSAAFHEVEAHGFFPRRGWVDDPEGGDVALPAAYVHDARRVAIRPSTAMRPLIFKVDRFDDALEHAEAEGCDAASFKPAA